MKPPGTAEVVPPKAPLDQFALAKLAKPARLNFVLVLLSVFLVSQSTRAEGLPEEFQKIRISTELGADLIQTEDDINSQEAEYILSTSDSVASVDRESSESASDISTSGETNESSSWSTSQDESESADQSSDKAQETEETAALESESDQPKSTESEQVTAAPSKDEVVAAVDSDATREPSDESEESDNQSAISEVEETVQNWAVAWSSQDVDSYLAHYSQDFSPHNSDLNLDQWKDQRQSRLTTPNQINLSLADIEIVRLENENSTIVFKQSYQSDTYEDVVIKSLDLIREDTGWKIVSEKTLKVIQ